MMDFDQILDECIQKLIDGSATLEDCLREYPGEARLEPLLRAAIRLNPKLVRPSSANRERARTKLKDHLRTHPRVSQDAGEGKAPDDPTASQERDRAFSLGLG